MSIKLTTLRTIYNNIYQHDYMLGIICLAMMKKLELKMKIGQA